MLWTPRLQEPSRPETKAGVRDEDCVASDYEVHLYGSLQTCQHSPHKILHHMVFLFCPQQLSACRLASVSVRL